jgi:hypothetical protein
VEISRISLLTSFGSLAKQPTVKANALGQWSSQRVPTCLHYYCLLLGYIVCAAKPDLATHNVCSPLALPRHITLVLTIGRADPRRHVVPVNPGISNPTTRTTTDSIPGVEEHTHTPSHPVIHKKIRPTRDKCETDKSGSRAWIQEQHTQQHRGERQQRPDEPA